LKINCRHLTVTVIVADGVILPAASAATAYMVWVVFVTFFVFQFVLNGADVSVARSWPST
jgi:hypothetical protein